MEMRNFETGATRDTAVGKGRFDCVDLTAFTDVDTVLDGIGIVQERLLLGDIGTALKYTKLTIAELVRTEGYDAILECGKVAEKGAVKYNSDNTINWQKGIPTTSFIDSFVRHWAKYKQGWKDENHLGSAVWNLQALSWTLTHKCECNDYEKGRTSEDKNSD